MNRRLRFVILAFSLGVFLTLCFTWDGGYASFEHPMTTMDAMSSFEKLAGQVGRSELYAREQAKMVQLSAPINLTESGIFPESLLTETLTNTVYLPLTAMSTVSPIIERRGIWVTRYDWTSYSQSPTPDDISAIVDNVSRTGFNTIFFQVRAAGDSFYSSELEPWSARLTTGPVSSTLGVEPGWDPLAVMIQYAHESGIEVHAYVNVYTAWLSPPDESQGDLWPPATTPPQMFDRFTYGPLYESHPGEYGLGYTWRQYSAPDVPMPLERNKYLWASPGVDQVQDYIAGVATDIISRYAVDGLHLDLVRYSGHSYSFDPFSNTAAGTVRTELRDQWQRDRITALVARISAQAHSLRPNILVSAAVWPVYVDKWGWGINDGYSDYFQDSKGWLYSDALDAIAPMLYGGLVDSAEGNWQLLMEDFASVLTTGHVYPGIGVYQDFSIMVDRINAARSVGTQGHVIFSYGGLQQLAYWDDLAQGPYRHPAEVPPH